MPQNLSKNLSSEELFKLLEMAPIGLLSFTSEWMVNFINNNFFEFGIVTLEDASKLSGKDIIESGFAERLSIKEELETLKGGNFFEKQINSIKTTDGANISVIIKGTPVFEGELYKGGILIIEDLKVIPETDTFRHFSKDMIDTITREISDIFFITDSQYKVIYYSTSTEKMNSSFAPDPLNNQIEQVFSQTFHYDISRFLNQATSERKEIKIEFSVLSAGGTKQIFLTKIIPFCTKHLDSKTSQDKPNFLISLKDITDQKDAEQFRKNEIQELKQYQYITSAITDAVIVTDLKGKIIFWNKAAEKLFHYTRSEVYGKSISKIINNFSQEYFENIKEEVEKGSIWESEVKFANNSGTEEYICVSISLSGEEMNKSMIFLCSSITERVRIERELRISEERFRNIVINANEFICNLDTSGYITYINPSFVRSFEYTEGELLEKNIKDLFDSEYKPNEFFDLSEFATLRSKPVELLCLTKSRKKIFLLANFSPILDFNNEPKYFNGVFSDITEKKEAEKELRTVRSVYEASRDGISVEVGRKFILANDSFAKMFGYTEASELIGKDSLDIVSDEDIPKVAKYIIARESREQAPSRYDFVGKRRNGSNFFVEASVTSYESDEKIYIVRICRDITERKRAQEALKDSEEKYRSITENIDDFLWTAEIINGHLRPVFYTSSVEKITGYEQEQFLTDSNLWLKILYPDDMGLFKKKLRNLLNDSVRYSDEFEFRIVNKSGNIIWVNNKLKVVRKNDGTIFKLYGLVSDISLNKKAEEELKKSTEELRELNSTKDKFISIISHDLRTPFSSILGFTDILLSEKDMTESQRIQYIKYIQESSQNMLGLVNSLLDWTRLQTGRIKFEPGRIKADEVIEKSVSIVNGAALKKNIVLELNVEKNLYIHADINLLMQVVNNLLSNAIKFTKADGKIIINVVPTSNYEKVQFSIIDNGVGIKKENMDKLFKVDSKFTLEGTAGEKGSGLGLSIVHDIIEKHGGEIWVESEYGSGSKFHFTIPVASASILLVDDSKTDRLLYSKILRNIIPQYKIEEANNGKEALHLIEESTPALVITDHNMPEMSGYELVRQLKISELKCKPPVIILSGDVNRSIKEEYRELGIEYVFQKPVSLSSFKEAIEKSLRKALFS
ncbi:MAG: PAS domain S-box protein [Bacteroidota bacterium]|nr:PAS domain S-box protein [Bacteroidota bacterium]